MSEFTIRNKAKTPILTLRPAVLQALLAARPESSSLALAKYCQDYKRVTGKVIHIDHEQNTELLKRFGADETGMWTGAYSKLPAPWFMVERCFVDGFLARQTSKGLLEDLGLAEAFFDMLDAHLERLPGSKS